VSQKGSKSQKDDMKMGEIDWMTNNLKVLIWVKSGLLLKWIVNAQFETNLLVYNVFRGFC